MTKCTGGGDVPPSPYSCVTVESFRPTISFLSPITYPFIGREKGRNCMTIWGQCSRSIPTSPVSKQKLNPQSKSLVCNQLVDPTRGVRGPGPLRPLYLVPLTFPRTTSRTDNTRADGVPSRPLRGRPHLPEGATQWVSGPRGRRGGVRPCPCL